MARLPNPGGDDGQWGSILNDFLGQAHDTSGSLKSDSVGASQIQDGAVTTAKISGAGATSGQVLSYNGSSVGWATVSGSGSVPDADGSTKGLVQLAGDLGGTAASPAIANNAVTTAKINNNAVSYAKLSATGATSGQVLSYNGSALAWVTPSAGGVTSVNSQTGAVTLTKSDVGLGNADNTSDATKNAATATLTNKTISGASNTLSNIPQSAVTSLSSDLSGKATDSAVVHNTGAETVAGVKTFSSSPIVPTPTTGTQAANKTYVDSVAAAGAADATTSSKGIVQLAGDLAGTAGSPSVAKVNGVAVSGTPTSGQVLTASSGTAASWSTPSGGSSLTVRDEGTSLTTAATSLNFTGAGVTATNSSGAVTVNIPGGAGGSGFPAWNIVHLTASSGNNTYTAANGDWLLIDASANGMTVTLPAPAANATVLIKKTDPGLLTVSVVGPGSTLVDPPTGAISQNNGPQAGLYLSDGTNWYGVGTYY